MTFTGSGGCKLTYLKRHFQLKVKSCTFMILYDLVTLGGNTANSLLQELHGIGSSSNIFYPNILCTKGRPRGALNQSTRRDFSGFGHLEGAKGRGRCNHCGGIGHNACTCNHNQA